MILNIKNIILTIGFCITIPYNVFANTDVYFYSDTEPGKVKLRWFIEQWPDNLTGFIIKRRYLSDDENKIIRWEVLNKLPICPEISINKDWSLIDDNIKEQNRLKEKTIYKIKNNKLKKTNKKEYIKRLKTGSELLTLLNNIKNSFDYAFINGFGCVDTKNTRSGKYEYGLFPVYLDKADKIPIAKIQITLSSPTIEWIKLTGTVENKRTKLKWVINDYWPDVIAGFKIMRRKQQKSMQKWEMITHDTIFPEIALSKNLGLLGLTDKEQTDIIRKTRDLITKGKLKEVTKDDFLTYLMTSSIDELQGYNMISYKDYDNALISGFGYIDQHFSSHKDVYEYGLFPVNTDDQMHKKPISTFVVKKYNKNDPGFLVDLKVDKANKGSIVRWSYDINQYHQRALIGYNVYRSEKEKNNFQKLNRTPLGTLTKKGESWLWHYIDRKINNNKQYTYSVAPVDILWREFLHTKEIFTSEKTYHENFRSLNIQIDSLAQQNDHEVAINWSLPSADEKLVNGFFVERSTALSKNMKTISQFLSPDTRKFVDNIHTSQNEKFYYYRIKVIGKESLIKHTAPIAFHLQYVYKLPAPKIITAKYQERNDISYVYLKWDDYDEINLNQHSGFVVYTDIASKDNLIRQASIPLIKSTSYKYKLGRIRGKEICFGIAGKSNSGVIGDMAITFCYIPINEMPRIKKLKLMELSKGKIKIKWEYQNVRELDGFQIFQNNNLISDEDITGKNVREYIADQLEPNMIHKFKVVAVSYVAKRSLYNMEKDYFYLQKMNKFSNSHVKSKEKRIMK